MANYKIFIQQLKFIETLVILFPYNKKSMKKPSQKFAKEKLEQRSKI